MRGTFQKYFPLLLLVFFLTGPVSCALKAERILPPESRATAYIPPDDDPDKLLRFAPVFIAEETARPFNRIGTPAAKYLDGEEEVYVDPSPATVYTRRQAFSTSEHHYTNLIYRIHFSEVPCGFFSFHLTCGKNSGLLIYITLDEKNRPVLITTLHTCGCFLAFVPTNYLSEKSFPDDWDTEKQQIYGEILPGRIAYGGNSEERLIIRLREETHRVMDVSVGGLKEIEEDFRTETYRRFPAGDLLRLPLGEGHTSFFEESGIRKGYVKNNTKPYERLLMSWWALDWYVGQDKRLGPPEETGVIFYTSLKFWDRNESNIWYFDRFLDYWGWGL